MARYGNDFNRNRDYGWNRGGWSGRSWGNDYDTDFNRGRYAQRGGRFGRSYGSEPLETGSYGEGGGFREGGFGSRGRGFGRTDFDEYDEGRFGGYGARDNRWSRGYGNQDRWGADFGRGYGRTDFREGGMYGGGMYGRGTGEIDRSDWRGGYDRDMGDRLRSGWNAMKRRVRRNLGGYDGGW